MPSDDVILNIRQIDGYPNAGSAVRSDALVIQRGGLGGPYLSLSPSDLVSTALSTGGDMTVMGTLTAEVFTGASVLASNAAFGLLTVDVQANINQLAINAGTLGGVGIATLNDISAVQAYADLGDARVMESVNLFRSLSVLSFNQRVGNIVLTLGDILQAGGAPICSPMFGGVPMAPTPPAGDSSNAIATTEFVMSVATVTLDDIIAAGGIVNPNPALEGIPTAPTPLASDNSTQIATTAFVQNALTNQDLSNYAPLNSPNFTGSPTAPTVPPGANDGRLATTAFVHAAVVAATAGVSSFNTRTGAVVLTGADITGAGGALVNSPAFTGVPTAPTAALGTSNTQIATTAFVLAELAGGGTVTSFNARTGAVVLQLADVTGAGGAPINSPALTGAPTAPTASAGTSTMQVATTAFVANAISAIGGIVTSFNGRSGAVSLQANDISAAGGAVLASPAFSGTPTAPTAAPGTNTAQIATTSFVAAAIAAGGGVSSVNGRTGAITIVGTDITGAGGALLASPAFTGVPNAPTAAPGTSTTQIATTAFVAAALTTGAVSSFNGRQGAVTLTSADVTGAGGAILASPGFTGTPTAPTAATATNTTQIATTAFVQNAINAIGAGVVSFNGRTGAVSLIQNDISAAGGAVLASPAFTGSPTAPTAGPGTSTTQLATTAFVTAAITAQGGPFLPLTGGNLSGSLVITTTTGAALSQLDLVANPAAVGMAIASYVGSATPANARWAIALGDGTAEGAGNSGNNFQIWNYSNTGVNIGAPLSILRANGNVTFGGQINAANGGTIGGIVLQSGAVTGVGNANIYVGPTTTMTNFGIAYGGVQGGGNSIAFGWSSQPTGYGAAEISIAGGWQGHVVRSVAISGQTFGVTLLQLQGGLTSAYMVADGPNQVFFSVAASDGRLKHNRSAPDRDALGVVNAVAVDQCDYRHPGAAGEGEHWDFTVVAQEVKALLPYAYMGPEDGGEGYGTLHPLHLITVLWRAVQQLSQRVEALEARPA